MLDRRATDVPVSGIDPQGSTAMTGPRSYATTIAIRTPADADDAAAAPHPAEAVSAVR
jgi:hypothetical protein